ncbi:MAG: archaeosine biosynthesis radical SAM protein RaSEA [Methanobacteriota archaeon]|nr:MAG: archaeosine biosynthesis radical SAM protein RaSEA [Euryarchaeota archaeon]
MGGRDSGEPALGRRGRDKSKSTRTAVSAWRERENVDGAAIDVGVIVLRSSGCAHSRDGGCSMCGYNVESREGVAGHDLEEQFLKAAPPLEDVRFLKIYTSGSFLDEREIPSCFREKVLKWCAERHARLLVETRAEFVSEEAMTAIAGIHDDLEVAIGLESANDKVLKYAINKNMTVKDFDRAAATVKKAGAALRSYVLLKPPFLTEAEALEDAIATTKHAALQSDTISINPVNVQRGTTVESLWRNWAYRPPWLWSVVEVLNSCTSLERKIVCEPTGGGKARGAHNCGQCDGDILQSIREHTISQNRTSIKIPECGCREIWESVMELEGLVADGTVDLQRMFRNRGD